MVWIKIGEHNVLNANAVKEISIELYGDGMYHVRFSLAEDDSIQSKGFKQYEECLELFNQVWDAMMNDESIDIS